MLNPMAQDGEPLEGDVEVDETAGGGRVRASDTRNGRQHVYAKKSRRPTIWAAVERAGRVRAQVVKSRSNLDLELNEYAWRYNERSNTTHPMLQTLVDNSAAC